MTTKAQIAQKNTQIRAKLPVYGVDVVLQTSDGRKALFIPCADKTAARFLSSQVNKTKSLDGMVVIRGDVAQR